MTCNPNALKQGDAEVTCTSEARVILHFYVPTKFLQNLCAASEALSTALPALSDARSYWSLTQGHCPITHTIKGGFRRAEKSRKGLMMMMKAAKLGWEDQEQGRSRAETGQEHS